ncbi:hypothetical protein [uncultured Friedmanniella sp.]|uniref:hypothetical protein n=1 Tax=uncultured Friedmanniella sp. TaxID=335381 RepID=UPI0035C9F9A3
MILLELDPNIVKPGWTPFLITIALAAVMYLLFRSMRRQFRRVDANFLPDDQPAAAEPVTVPPTTEHGSTTAGSTDDVGKPTSPIG